MRIYLDTGNIEEIQKAAQSGLIDGVTTNPTLVAKTGKEFKKTLKEIIAILKKYCEDDFTVSAEVTNTSSAETIIKEGRALAKIDKHILVKVPLTLEGLKAVKQLAKEKIRCNVTLCFSQNQALLAAKAGAYLVSPFVGRVDDEGYDGIDVVEDIVDLYETYGFETGVLAASIRTAKQVTQCAEAGADLITIPYKVFEQMFYNPLTDKGLKRFEDDWKQYEKGLEKKKVPTATSSLGTLATKKTHTKKTQAKPKAKPNSKTILRKDTKQITKKTTIKRRK